jgi:hypothetical protein
MLAATPLLAPGRLAAQHAPAFAGARILLRGNRLWMQAHFGPRGPYAFIIDTGTVLNLIERRTARELGLRELRPVRLVGVGGVQEFTLYQAEDVRLGNARVGDVRFGAYPGEDLPFHPEARGALAASVVTTADSDLDFDSLEWRIYPGGRTPVAGFERLPARIDAAASRDGAPRIFVNAEIDGQTGRFLLDTGAPTPLSLGPAMTRRVGYWNDRTPFSPQQWRGIGGEGAAIRIVRGQALSLGGLRFERPLVSLVDPNSRDRDHDGIIGLPIIQQMNLSTEVGPGRIWAKRNAQPAPPERYGMSGLWAEPRGDHLVLAIVSPGSPAADAGLQAGDEIHGVPLAMLVRALGGGPGDVVPVTYRRAGQERTTRLTLRPYL